MPRANRLPGVTGQTVADAISSHGHRGVSYQPRLDRLHTDMGRMLAEGDLVLSLGAGNVHEQLATLAAQLVVAERLEGNCGRGR
jgi:UDP-N-acetylmuramate-alanine ligase